MTIPATTEELAALVRVVLEAADLDAYRELLDPDARWGPPDDDVSGCHNRDEILAWYQLGRDSGLRANVVETVVSGDKIFVGLQVHRPGDTDDDESVRWQVLTVVDGRVCDIRGFEDRDEAVGRLG
jgi:SnoaL-like domain